VIKKKNNKNNIYRDFSCILVYKVKNYDEIRGKNITSNDFLLLELNKLEK